MVVAVATRKRGWRLNRVVFVRGGVATKVVSGWHCSFGSSKGVVTGWLGLTD